MDIRAWLEHLGLGQYAEAFAANDIDASLLPTLTADDLKELGVTSLGHRKRLLSAIAELERAETSLAAQRGAPTPSQANASPEAYIPGHLARKILDSRAALEGERKLVTVLFADLRGSLSLIEHVDPESAREILDGALGAMMHAVHRYEGMVNKVLGDGVMALFGAPLALEDHALRACYAALAIQRAMQVESRKLRETHGVELSARVGLNSGEVVVRGIGNDLSMDYDAIGTTVHLANRMEQLASPGATRLTATTARLAAGFIETTSLGAIPVKGMDEPVESFELKGPGPARTRLHAAAGRGLTPFVGRESELQALHRARGLTEAGQGQIVTLVGEPGVGKSRLFHEFLRSQELRSWRVLETSAVSSGKAVAWAPVIDLLKIYFGLGGNDDPRSGAEKVIGKLLMLDETLQPVLPAVLDLLGLPSDDREWHALGAAQRRRRMLDGIKAVFLRESRVQPLALVFEDMHWVDDETQALVDGLVESIPASRILLLANYRPEYEHGWSYRGAYTQLRIDPLGTRGAQALLSVLLGDAPDLDDLKRRLIEHNEGNPLFLEESVHTLVETGVLEGQRGAYRLAVQPAEIKLPASVLGIIAARIDRLSSAAKALLQCAAVIGEDVPVTLLEAVSDLPTDALHEALAHLRVRELLYEAQLFPEIVYTFKHGLTRRVAYESMLQRKRQDMHRRVAEALKAQRADAGEEMVEALAHHFEQGGRPREAAGYYLRAALKAKQRYTYPRAADFARRAAALAEEIEDASPLVQALELLGDLYSLMGELDAANASYERAFAVSSAPEVRRRVESKRHRPGLAIRDGGRIAFYEHGRGDETLLFVAAITYGLEVFQPLVEELCQEFRIITIDPRGTGHSDPLHRPYTLAQHVEDTRAVIEEAGGPVTAIGISRGSNKVIRLADAYPALVNRLVLVGAPPDRMGPDSPIQRLDYFETAGRFIASGDIEGLVRYLFERVYTEPDTRDLIEKGIERRLRMPRETLLSFFDADETMDVKPLLGTISTPTLVTHGTEDKQVSFAAAEYIAQRIPGAILYPFEGRGHLPLFTATKEFCDVVRQFIRTGKVLPAT